MPYGKRSVQKNLGAKLHKLRVDVAKAFPQVFINLLTLNTTMIDYTMSSVYVQVFVDSKLIACLKTMYSLYTYLLSSSE